ncbi:MAG: mandelate racemase/muconate lactonizing enzyme family protein [Nevskiaceae bacterium]|jgi:L-alanine-DL-glutamate epimerase-like enolase superfamily enzyme|nr:mandelate racemase/muconate lactonizing enzyme family protein [Nevskiaceae bacterium]
MQRRTFLGQAMALMAAGATPFPLFAAAAAGNRGKVKITDVQAKRVKVVRELGALPSPPGSPPGRAYRVGGENVTLITTDAGLTGLARGVSPQALASAKQRLIGADPLDVQLLAPGLYALGGGFNPISGGADIEIALWDLAGQILGMPLWRLWGGRDGKLMPYASQWTTGRPAERAEMAQRVREAGWRAIKFRSHFQTMEDDVAVMEQTRKLVGKDFIITTDANQAGESPDGGNSGRRWDYARALETALEFDRYNVYWLEEPLSRWNFDELAQLSHSVKVRIAGGEANRALHDFRVMLEKDSFDIIQFEVCQIGPSLARQIATLASAYHKNCVPHAGFGPGVFAAGHVSASLQNGVFFGPGGTGPTWELIHEPPVIDIQAQWEIYENAPRIDKQGFMQLPDAPGLGVILRKDLLEDA